MSSNVIAMAQATNETSHPAAERMMIAQVQVHQWRPTLFDREATQEVADAHNAESEEVGRFYKRLIKRESYKPVTQAKSEVERVHKRYTSTWSLRGQRLLPCELYQEWKAEMTRARLAYDAACDTFCSQAYQAEIAERERELNGLFKASDYPSADEIRSKFSVKWQTLPLPNADDAYKLVGVGQDADEIAAEVRQSTERAIREAHNAVVSDLVKRAREFVLKCEAYNKKVRSKKSKRGGGLRETAIENLRDLIAIVSKGLNVEADSRLDDLCKELDAAIIGADIEELRADTRKRNAKVKAVKATLDKFEGVF